MMLDAHLSTNNEIQGQINDIRGHILNPVILLAHSHYITVINKSGNVAATDITYKP